MNNNIAYISVGSNIKPKTNIKNALKLLHNHFKHIRTSSFYKTKPIIVNTKNYFINGVWEIKTNINPIDLKYNILKKIEKELKRIRTNNKYISRTIDLDIILFDDLILKNSEISIPDSNIYNRSFISYPLLELNPDIILPDTKISIKEICKTIKADNMYIEKDFTMQLKNLLER